MFKFMHKHRTLFIWLLHTPAVWTWIIGLTGAGLVAMLAMHLTDHVITSQHVTWFVGGMFGLMQLVWLLQMVDGFVHSWRNAQVRGNYFEYRRRYGGQWWLNDPWLSVTKRYDRLPNLSRQRLNLSD